MSYRHRIVRRMGGDMKFYPFAEFGGKKTHVGSGAAGGAVEGGEVVEDGHGTHQRSIGRSYSPIKNKRR